MDGNKDDALKCFKIGKQALESGDRTRALNFFTKARRLDPSLPVDELLATIDQNATTFADSGPTDPNHPKESTQVRRRAPRSASSSSVSGPTGAYTEEQVVIVKEINRKKDYYEILGLEKSCLVEDVRKAYRKLSLKVHPDKNQAPGAEDAFKSVSKAFQCLSDEESRRKYDLTGSEEVVYERQPARRHAGFSNGMYYEEFDADEIFRQFFGGMAPATNGVQFRMFNFGGGMGGGRGGVDHGSGFNYRVLLQLLPVLVILLLNMLPSSEPVYALSRSYPYEYKFTTQRGVNFYVKHNVRFENEYPMGSQQRAVLERNVERDYVSVLAQNCRYELQRQQWGFVRETPHCEMLERFQSGASAS